PLGAPVVSFAMALMAVRFCLALPMAALDGPRGLLSASWDLTWGSTFRLLLLCIVVAAPVALLKALVGLAAPDRGVSGISLPWYAFGLIYGVSDILGSALTISACALALSAIGDDAAEADQGYQPP